ncbi:MAG: 30S ribosome-binding factor RbfA [Gammaproteobacteria bacterium]|jgi:ribosome-binding factor A|nr:MAG: 30S ribosome-binding factor RbfA [Gammaproteobacteria bacterium]
MQRQYGRNQRVADLIQRELAPLFQRDLRNPEFGLVTISRVDLSPDLGNARVFLTSIGGTLNQDSLITNINKQASHFRHELAGKLRLRSVPKLHFTYDTAIEKGERLYSLIASLKTDSDSDQTP